jgi:uncharacterized protein YyaL (SSP411 family)
VPSIWTTLCAEAKATQSIRASASSHGRVTASSANAIGLSQARRYLLRPRRQLGRGFRQLAIAADLARGREQLAAAVRSARDPTCTTKIVTAWNSLVISALAHGVLALLRQSFATTSGIQRSTARSDSRPSF